MLFLQGSRTFSVMLIVLAVLEAMVSAELPSKSQGTSMHGLSCFFKNCIPVYVVVACVDI